MSSKRSAIADVINEAKAIEQDIDNLSPLLSRMVRTDPTTGERYVDEENKNYVIGGLWGVIEQRQEARVAQADERLSKAYEALRDEPKPRSIDRRIAWEATMLRHFDKVTAGLAELVAAKVDARIMSASRADEIRTEATKLQQAAAGNVSATMRRALRIARAA